MYFNGIHYFNSSLSSCADSTDFPNSLHLSLSSIAHGRSFKLHPVSVNKFMLVSQHWQVYV